MKRETCDSGTRGCWRSRLRANYQSFAEFLSYAQIYNLPQRLGYKSALAAWRANPIVQGSTNPSDYRRA